MTEQDRTDKSYEAADQAVDGPRGDAADMPESDLPENDRRSAYPRPILEDETDAPPVAREGGSCAATARVAAALSELAARGGVQRDEIAAVLAEGRLALALDAPRTAMLSRAAAALSRPAEALLIEALDQWLDQQHCADDRAGS